tara:strand:- start:8027 stop:8203 length:177 start_codon:yes stop_codon:yes gene_type:complete
MYLRALFSEEFIHEITIDTITSVIDISKDAPLIINAYSEYLSGDIISEIYVDNVLLVK